MEMQSHTEKLMLPSKSEELVYSSSSLALLHHAFCATYICPVIRQQEFSIVKIQNKEEKKRGEKKSECLDVQKQFVLFGT